ncbi:MAG TPA: calcium-binding protein [Solirubrobacterales bacterium]
MRTYLGRAALLLALASGLVSMAASVALAAPAASELPSCAEGPERVGDEVLGTPCDDRIVAPPSVAVVDGGPGDDVIVGANSAPVAASFGSAESGLHLEVGSQTFNGGEGNDIVYGDRGNDTLRGGAGNDRLYGGIGDDVLEGGDGDDLLSGGFGSDKIDGQAGNDYVRGDATIDHIFDTGGGFDTLSFATGITPGFGTEIATGASGFPSGAEGERGVYLQLGTGGENANDGIAAGGGGVDEVQPGVFERIVGTPFSDYIVGSGAAEDIWGGGGADVIEGGGGGDTLHGGADGDYLDSGGGGSVDGEAGEDNCTGTPSQVNCEGGGHGVEIRDSAKISVGEVTGAGVTQIYLVGSSGADNVTATYLGSSVGFTLTSGSFDTSAGDGDTQSPTGGCTISGSTASCPLGSPLDSVLLAGMAGNDTIAANGFPDGAGVVVIGGGDEDTLTGGGGEDILVDGNGSAGDTLRGGAGDDALVHNGGADLLEGGEGSDLFLSVSICDDETIAGGPERAGAATPDRDNASWARLGEGVDARLDLGTVGRPGAGELPECGGEPPDHMEGIEDLEASNHNDVLYGNEGNNQLLGHKGEDIYYALGGNDSILANSGSPDKVIDCGPGLDQAIIDLVSKAVDPTPIECESVREGAPDEFNELPLLSEPTPAAPPVTQSPPPPRPDRKPPRTKLLRHPAKLLRVAPLQRKLVAFRFAASEKSSFRCKLDRKPYAACRSPRQYRVAVGRHLFRLFAIDAAGNRDRTPAVFQFRVVAKKRHGPTHRAR